ncbi:Ribosome-interacting GTPase 2 [Diatrype stigma]|uniref:Ribosome-interacting GTPase 2 n=1 Tax=Diatrype stigma TaxID=117547 RepID=A0AAN9UQU5_9PEZI
MKVSLFTLSLFISRGSMASLSGAHTSRGRISVDDSETALLEKEADANITTAATNIKDRADNGLTGIGQDFNMAPGDEDYVIPGDWEPEDGQYECWGEPYELDGIYTTEVGTELVNLCENGGHMCTIYTEDSQKGSAKMVNITEKIKEKLARLRAQLLEPGPGAGGGAGAGFDVSKSGDARIALVGFPSVGKSTFLSKVTKTRSEVASYAFTTLTAIPGVLEYGGAEIQLLDLPGIIEGAAEGKGRGRQVISAAKTSDLILMVLDATKRAEQRALLEAELEAVGIRLNREPPNIYLKPKKAGGMKITFQSPPKNIDEKMVFNILRDYKLLNVEVLVRDDEATVDDLIDVIMRDHRKYIKCLYVYNKIDSVSIEFLDQLAREPHTAVMSCELDLGIRDVVDRCWRELRLIRVYTKRKGADPDFGEALIVRSNSTIEDVCDRIHRTLKDTYKYALVWGASARHVPQRVGLGHVVADEDVVYIVSGYKA